MQNQVFIAFQHIAEGIPAHWRLMYTQLVNYSRRDLSLLLPALAAAGAPAKESALPSNAFRFEDLPVKSGGPNGQNSSRAIMKGQTHSGYDIEMHITELAPGLAPHAPHHHVHEEAVFLLEGTIEVTITGKSNQVESGFGGVCRLE